MAFERYRSCTFAAAMGFGVVTVLSPSAFSQGAQNLQTTGPIAVGVQLLTDKDAYRVGDAAVIRILLTNKTAEPIYIRRPLDWGFNSSVQIWAKDVTSDNFPQLKFIPDTIDPPPRSKEDFIRLDSDHIYGVLFRVPMKALGIEKPGKYELNAIYHSQVSRAEVRFGLPSWSGEQYALQAQPVVISVQ